MVSIGIRRWRGVGRGGRTAISLRDSKCRNWGVRGAVPLNNGAV